MGKFTHQEDPKVDQLVESHLQRIVDVVRSHFEPYAIVLRGSFGRGEGSVILDHDRPIFLSDYEIDVIDRSPFHRSLLSNLSRDLTREFGVSTGLRLNLPDCMIRKRQRGIAVSPEEISISLYEYRYGSEVIWGHDFISSSPAIDHSQIMIRSGIQLMLNRMAESLLYMSDESNQTERGLESYYWINKTILSCAESLLVLWKQYHFSYEERGRRFSILAYDHLDFMPETRNILIDLVARATEFKLRPKVGLYKSTIRDTWLYVIPICIDVFRHVVERGTNLYFSDYSEYPRTILNEASKGSLLNKVSGHVEEGFLELYKALKAHSLPPSLPVQLLPSQIVYAIIPLLFLNYGNREANILMHESRYWLSKLKDLRPVCSDPKEEWNYLCQQLTDCWKIYCY